MFEIQWQKKFSVGNSKIDIEHKTFVELLRSLGESIDAQKPAEVLERQLKELELYARFHFYSEESMMLEHGYPGYEEHRSKHQELLHDLLERVARLHQEPDSHTELIMFLFAWFAEHTAETDLELANFIRDKPKFSRAEGS